MRCPPCSTAAAGKDRTGILAALILGSLGVAHEDIVADYALTEAGMARMRAWSEVNFPEASERMKDVPSAFFAARPEAMRGLLAQLTDAHGSVAEYVLSIGVPAETLAKLADALLVD